MENSQTTVIRIYIIFIISIVLNFVPLVSAQAIGAALFLIMIITAHICRFRSKDGSIMQSHMKYLIKSFWISSLFLVIGILLSSQLADNSILNNAANNVINGASLSEAQIQDIVMEYTRYNLLVFSATLLPSVIYLIYRCIKGIVFVKKHRNFDNHKSWF